MGGRTWVGGAAAAAAVLVLCGTPAAAGNAATLFAAGSLKAALSDVAKDFEAATGVPVATTFGPSGLLKDRLEKGEAADVFASANMNHPQALHAAGLAGEVRPFARNTLCAIAQGEVAVTPDTLLERMLDPAVRVGTSTPKADPAGDYAWDLFGKADALRSGSAETLRGKALQLTGGPDSAKPPAGRNVYGWVMENRQADLFLTYCTNAKLATAEVPALKIVAVPDELSVGATYGLTILTGGDTGRGRALADYILSPAGQAVLARYGFASP